MVPGHWRNLVEDVAAPDVALLDIVKALVAETGEHVDRVDVAHLVVLSPVVRQVQLRLLGRCVSPVASVRHDEWHVSAPLSEQSQALEVSLWQRARLRWTWHLISWQCSSHRNIIDCWEVISIVLLNLPIS